MILITRADPAIGLARWRARGELIELRASELAFTAAEARELLVDRGGLRLDDEQIEILVRRTEGWPAALYLAALWLRTVDDLDRAVHEFGGEHRYVAEYLSHEVLAALDADHRSFLLRVAVLGGFTADCATPCSAERIPRPCWPSSRSPTCSSRASSVANGSGFIRCSRSSPAPSS